MRPEVPAQVPLVCPRCRTRSADGREMHTVSLRRALRSEGDEILDGELGCDNDRCGATYPIVDGIPVLVAEPGAVIAGQIAAVLADRPPATLALLAGPLPDDSPLVRHLDHLSVYLDAHWGDRAVPPPDVPAPAEAFGGRALAERLAALPDRARHTVELGCSVGRGLLELARTSDLVVGVELDFGALRAARRLLAGQALDYGRKGTGRHYHEARIAPPLPARHVALVCGDALDPPLAPSHFDRVVALNVLDSVRVPAGLLSVADGLLGAGGELILSSPWSWQSAVVDDAHRPPGDDGPGWLAALLEGGRGLEAPYALLEQAEVPWWLRREHRAVHLYLSHYLRARKLAPVRLPP